MEVLERLSVKYRWSKSISNLSGKLHRETLKYREAVEMADVLGYEIVWIKRGEVHDERTGNERRQV